MDGRDMTALVRAARTDDLAAIQAVGVRAGRRFAEVADPRIARCADDPPVALEVLRPALAHDLLWVAEVAGAIAGFLVAVALQGSLHVEEVAVDPAHGGRGLGSALLEEAAARAGQLGLPVTLTTFAEVAWNRPLYERRGFGVVPDDELPTELAAIRAAEAEAGLDPELRVVMRRDPRLVPPA